MKTVYVVLSRDTDFIIVTTSRELAENAKIEQIKDEEMAGGRPSVYIKTALLLD